MINRIFFRGPNQEKRRASCLLIIAALIVIGLFLIKIMDFKIKSPAVPLLLPSPYLVEFASPARAQENTKTEIFLPEDYLGSEIFTIGLYPKQAGGLPEGSVIYILAKDGWRFAEITQQPGGILEREIGKRPEKTKQELRLGSISGTLIHLNPGLKHCIPPPENGALGMCLLTHQIIFELKNQVVIVAGSKSHITLGELIALARSIVAKQQPAISANSDSAVVDEAAPE